MLIKILWPELETECYDFMIFVQIEFLIICILQFYLWNWINGMVRLLPVRGKSGVEAQKLVEGTQSDSSSQTCYTSIAFDERVTFGFNVSGHYLVRVRILHYLHVGSMQQTHTQNYSLINRSIAQLRKISKEIYLQMGRGGRVRIKPQNNTCNACGVQLQC